MKKATLILLTLAMLLMLAACGSGDAAAFSGGSGTEADPYLIGTAKDLWKMAELINTEQTQDEYLGAHYLLTADIDLGKKEWTPIGYYAVNENYFRFEGVFDGDGHTVSGISINYSDPLAGKHRSLFGLFGQLEGTVKNLTISDSTITAKGDGNVRVGAVAGYVSDGVIENCHSTDTVSITGSYHTGGICGNISSDAPLLGCTNAASVNNSSDVGKAAGIAGYANCAILECSNSGKITSQGEAAGICGNANGGISDCTNSGSVQAASHAAGIIINFGDGALNHSMNDAAVTLARCTNTGDVTSTGVTAKDGTVLGKCAGGIAVGCRTGKVVDCVNTGNVTAGAEAGGILAYFQRSSFGEACEEFVVSNSKNSGTITTTEAGYSVGGICGIVYGDVTKICFEACENTGAVNGIGAQDVANGGVQAGGILGNGSSISEMVFENCVNAGEVKGSDEVGGIVAKLNAKKDEVNPVSAIGCSNSGALHVTDSRGLTQVIYVGGIVGRCALEADEVNTGSIDLKIENCTNTGALGGDTEKAILCADDLCASYQEPELE